VAEERLVNEMTGEAMTLSDYIANTRSLERTIFRLDNTINDLKSSLKGAKEDKLKAIAALRSNAREVRLRSKPTAIGRGRATKVEKS